jgi:hypothetical protein
MMEAIRMQTLFTLFTFLIASQFLLVVFHDLADIPGWTHGSQVQSVIGRRKVWLATLANALFPGLAVAFCIFFRNRPRPGYVADYWVIYCAITLVSAIGMWYVPYFLGASEEKKRDYSRMYAATRQALPPRGDNPRPNLLHLCFHLLFVINLLLALALRFGNA